MSELIRLEQRKTERFKTIDLTAIDSDPRLSWKAKGLHTYLMSRPPNWEFYYADLLKRASDKRGAIKSGLKELQVAGYLLIKRDKDAKGRWAGRTWIVTQDPKRLPLDGGTPLFENEDGKAASSVSRKTVLRENGKTENQQGSKEQGSKKHIKKEPSAAKPRFSPVWYKQNVTDYQEIKGVTLSGPEFGEIQRTLKSIYKAGHKPEDVRALMKAFEQSKEEWTDNWTIHTVARKLPEFLAGKLFGGDGRDTDRIRALKADIAQIDRYLEYQIKGRLTKLDWRAKDNGGLSLEESEEKERLERIRSEKQAERAKLEKQLRALEVSK